MGRRMISVALRTISLSQYPNINIDYRAELLRLCQESHMRSGQSMKCSGSYLLLAQRIEQAGDVLELEPHEHAVLLHRLQTQRWNLIVPEILAFVREFAEAGQVTE
jgi:hypothetical protein